MPKSRNRKNHKQKAQKRAQGIRDFRRAVQKLYQSAAASRIQVPEGDPLGAQEALEYAQTSLPNSTIAQNTEIDPYPHSEIKIDPRVPEE